MRVLIYGAGVQGSLLAHTLIRGQQDVTVLARGARAEQLHHNGLVLRHYLQFRTTVDRVRIITELSPEDRYDLILVTMKYNDFPQVLPTLAQNISENIVLVGNNATASEMEKELKAASLTPKQVAFGFQLSGGIREKRRTVAIRMNAGAMVIGGLGKEVAFKETLAAAFAHTRYKLRYEADIDAWLKSHMISILPLSMASVAKNRHFRAVARDNKLLNQMVTALDEGYEVLKDLGYAIIPAKQAELVKRHKRLNVLFYKLYHYSPLASKVDGSFAEIEGLYEALVRLQLDSRKQMPQMEKLMLQAKAATRS